jgi:hypothetical protein
LGYGLRAGRDWARAIRSGERLDRA